MTFVQQQKCRIELGRRYVGSVEDVEMEVSDEVTAAAFVFKVELALDVSGEGGVGLARLGGVLRARAGSSRVYLGRIEMAVKDNNAQFVSTDKPWSYRVSLKSFVTPSKLAAFERIRSGDAELELGLRGEFVELGGRMCVSHPWDDVVRGRIAQSDWVGYLSQAGLNQQVCVQFSMVPALDDPPWRAIGNHLRSAQNHLRHGNWGGVAVSVREALDALGDRDEVSALGSVNAQDRTIDQRWLAVKQGLRGICNVGPHSEDVPGRRLDRQDAEVCLAIALALFSRLRPPPQV